MICPSCHSPGRAIRVWFSRPKLRIPWTVFRCYRPACEFAFAQAVMGDEEDGRIRMGKPTWMLPTREVLRA